jgi:hypothetical protein
MMPAIISVLRRFSVHLSILTHETKEKKREIDIQP